MKKLNYHNPNLLSIKSINTEVWSDKIFFKNLVMGLMLGEASVIGSVRRACDFIDLKPLLDQTKLQGSVLIARSEDNEIVFEFKGRKKFEEPLEILIKYWTAYEQVAFAICSQPISMNDPQDLLKYSWDEIVKVTRASYVFFKGIEENVLWIGKSSKVNFPDMNQLISFEAKLS